MTSRFIMVLVVLVALVSLVVVVVGGLMFAPRGQYLTAEDMTSVVASLQTDQKALAGKVQQLSDSIPSLSALSSSVSASSADVASLKLQIASLSSLSSDLSTLTSKLTSLQGELGTVQAQLQTLSAQTGTDSQARTDIASLIASVATLKSSVDDLRHRVSSLANTQSSAGVRLVGNTASTVAGTSSPAGILVTSQFVATRTDILTHIQVRATSSGEVKVALYDNYGSLLASEDYGTAVVAGLNDIYVSDAEVYAGDYYWLAVIADTRVIAYSSASNATSGYVNLGSYDSFSFPLTLPTLTTSSSWNLMLSGWGD